MGINDVSAAFTPWLANYTASRNNGDYVAGRWVAGVASTISFRGVIQNSSPKDLLSLPEGRRTEESIKIHTTTELKPAEDNADNGDVIPYEGQSYMVVNVAIRKIGNYFKAIAVKL
ncbi:MAG: hypothetical protein GY861_24450 [bacterium]|nr:hypothetical protein [bacterium]